MIKIYRKLNNKSNNGGRDPAGGAEGERDALFVVS